MIYWAIFYFILAKKIGFDIWIGLFEVPNKEAFSKHQEFAAYKEDVTPLEAKFHDFGAPVPSWGSSTKVGWVNCSKNCP